MRTTFLAIFGILILLTLVRANLVHANQALGLVWVTDDNPTRRGQMDGFIQSTGKPIRIDPTNGTVEKVIVQSLGGVGPDVFDCGDASQLSAYVRAGIALDLTDELKARGIDVERDTFKGCMAQAVYQGRVYGVPTNIAADGVWMHEELVPKELIRTKPRTWDELGQLAQKLMKRDSRGRVTQYGLLFEWWNWKHFVASCGGQVFDKNGEKCLLDQPNAIKGIQVMYDLVYKYKVAPSPADEASMATQGGWGSGSISYFGARRGAMAIGARWWLASLNKYPGLRLDVMESPVENGGAPRAYGRATMINKDSPRRAEAFQFLEYLSGRRYNQIVDEGADATPAFRAYATREGTTATWTSIAEKAAPDVSSPYIAGNLVDRIITKQIDLVKADSKTPAEAMKSAAAEINRLIAEARSAE
jgi:multiple sugar transport system substrate-binding protein